MPDAAQASELIEKVLERPFTFREQAVPTPAEYRPNWRTALVLLLVGACYGRRTSWHQLHVLNWASRNRANQAAFERFKGGQARLEDAIVRYDPSLDRAIDLALFARLLERRSGDVLALSARGAAVVDELREADVLSAEKDFLSRVAPVSQTFVDSLISRGHR